MRVLTLSALGSVLLPVSAFALDTAAAVTAVEGAGDNIEAVGVAIIVLAATALAIRWVKATFF
jgi:hypothetical protein